MRQFPAWWLAALPFGLAACDVGLGSDIGPRLPTIPSSSSKCVVLDDAGRAVCGATVAVRAARAITGRNGRGELFDDARGRVIVEVDTQNAAAQAGDTLGGYRVAMTLTDRDLPAVLHVPVLPDSASAVVPIGTQVVATPVTSVAGSIVTVGVGATVGVAGGIASLTLRVGDLQAQHLPGDLPSSAPGARLVGRAVHVEPAGATFAPGASLDVADDLLIGAGPAQLFWLEPETGEWIQLAGGGTAAGGRITAAGAVTRGGIYVFATTVATATVTGRVVDADARPVRSALVRVDHLATKTRGDGTFVVEGVPAALANGAPRSAAVEVFAGGGWLAARATTAAIVASPTTVIGDVVLDTVTSTNVRVQQVARGLADAVRPVRISTQLGDAAFAQTSDDAGQSLFEDVPTGWFGFQEGRTIDAREVFYGQSVALLDRDDRWQDSYQFLAKRDWYLGSRSSRTLVTDAIGGGPLFGAFVVQGAVPGANSAGTTREGGVVFVTRDFAGRATATLRSERPGQVVVSAFSIVTPNGEHLELPLQRARRTPFGAFDRHAIVAGRALGADPMRDHELRATRRISLQEWWEDVAEDVRLPAALPIDVDVATTHDAFRVGVPRGGGHLALAETATTGAGKTLLRAGVAADLVLAEGARTDRDLEFGPAAGAPFVVAGALLGADSELDPAQLSLALALQQPSGRIVDVVRGLRGNHAASGDDLVFTLPPLTGPFAGHGWLALLDGSWPVAGSTLRCSTLVSLPRLAPLPSFPRGELRLGTFPDIQAPANGATVPASGFTVEYALPATALYGTIDLRSDTPGESRSWRVVMPRTTTSFAFVMLPTDVPTPLVAGRTWTLTVSAHFGDGDVTGTFDPYREVTTFLQSIGTVERGVSTVLARTVQITTN